MNPIRDWRVKNALKLVTDVIPQNGGRMLRLHSTFTIRNNTSHMIDIFAQQTFSNELNREYLNSDRTNTSYKLNSGEYYNVPIELLHQSALCTDEKSLGRIFIKPGMVYLQSEYLSVVFTATLFVLYSLADLKAAEDELGILSQVKLSHVDFSIKPIDFMAIIQRTSDLFQQTSDSSINIAGYNVSIIIGLCY